MKKLFLLMFGLFLFGYRLEAAPDTVTIVCTSSGSNICGYPYFIYLFEPNGVYSYHYFEQSIKVPSWATGISVMKQLPNGGTNQYVAPYTFTSKDSGNLQLTIEGMQLVPMSGNKLTNRFL